MLILKVMIHLVIHYLKACRHRTLHNSFWIFIFMFTVRRKLFKFLTNKLSIMRFENFLNHTFFENWEKSPKLHKLTWENFLFHVAGCRISYNYNCFILKLLPAAVQGRDILHLSIHCFVQFSLLYDFTLSLTSTELSLSLAFRIPWNGRSWWFPS